ncbi:MAG: EF-hand domain-containing protein [Lysobacterales bacterium]
MKTLSTLLLVCVASAPALVVTDVNAQSPRVGERNPLDSNGDGQVSQDEFIAASAQRAERRFGRLDRNEDGIVTADDFADLPERPDVDRQALRSCIEQTLDITLPEPPDAGSRFDAADLDGDGVITLDEALVSAENTAIERFDRLDTNADGVLERSEVRQSRRRAARLRNTRRQCLDEQQEINAMLGS